MKIAFDLDDTLTPTTKDFSVGAVGLGFPLNLIFKEKLRIGAVKLLKELSKSHEVWIYTTSLRSELYITSWFKILGIKLGGVINTDIHNLYTKNTKYQDFSKAPELFGIDALVDDSCGVGLECEKQGIHFILVEPNDDNWAVNVIKQLTC